MMQQQRPGMPRPPMVPRPALAPGLVATGRPVGISPQMGMQNRPQMNAQMMMQQGSWQQGQVVMPGQMGMPRPMLNGYRPQMMQTAAAGKQTPETVPVGVMATM